MLAQVDRFLSPADEAAIFLILNDLGELFGYLRPEQAQKYMQLLSDIPERALAAASQRCLIECTAFPWPKEILERADEFHELKTTKTRLETALWRIDLDERRRRK